MGTAQSTLSWDDIHSRGYEIMNRGAEYNEFIRIRNAFVQRESPLGYNEFCEIVLKRNSLPEKVKRQLYQLCCRQQQNFVDCECFLRTLFVLRRGNVKCLRRYLGDLIPPNFEFNNGYWIEPEDAYASIEDDITLITNLEEKDLKRIEDFFKAHSTDGYAVYQDFEDLMFPACSSSIISGIFNMCDLLGCKKVSQLEFVLAISSISQGPAEERIKYMARIWDQGNKGYLDVNDVMQIYNDFNIEAGYRELHTSNGNQITFVDFLMWVMHHKVLKEMVLKKLLLICNICLGVPLTQTQKNEERAFDTMLEVLSESTLDDFKDWTLVPVGWPKRAVTAIGLGNFLPAINLRQIVTEDYSDNAFDPFLIVKPNVKLGDDCIAVPTAWLRTLFMANRQEVPKTVKRKTVKFTTLRSDFKWPEEWHEKQPNARVFLDIYPIIGQFYLELNRMNRKLFKTVQMDRSRAIVDMVNEWLKYETELPTSSVRVVLRKADDVADSLEITPTTCIADLTCIERAVFNIIIHTDNKSNNTEETVSSKHAATTPTVAHAPCNGTGIINKARECYINSVLQCLSVVNSFKQIAPESYLKSVELKRPHQFSEALRTILMDLWESKKEFISADRLKKLFRERHTHFDDEEDQDAHEALENILEMVHEELKTTNESEITNGDIDNNNATVSKAMTMWERHVAKNISFITHAFDGFTGSELNCRKCGYISPTFETFRSFNVTLHHQTTLVVRYFTVNETQTKFVERVAVIPQTFTTTDLKQKIAKEQGVPEDKLYLHLPDMRDETAVDNSEYLMVKVAPLSMVEELIVYELPRNSDAKLAPFVCPQRKIREHGSIIAERVDRYTTENAGPPLLFQVPEKMTGAKFYNIVNDYINRIKAIYPLKPGYLMNRAIIDCEKTKELPFYLVYTEKNADWCSRCHWLNYCRGCLIPNDDTPVDLTSTITIQWKPMPYFLYFEHLFHALRSVDDSNDTLPELFDTSTVSLEAALKGTLQPETLDTPLTCEGCKEKCFFEKSLYFVITPTTMVINLQRFARSERGGWIKDKRRVTFPLVDFDLTPYFGPGFKPDSLYECIAFIVHIGELHTGHYISYYKRNDTWFLCNDEKVISVPLSQIDFENASVIFYQQQTPVTPYPVLVSDESHEEATESQDEGTGSTGYESA